MNTPPDIFQDGKVPDPTWPSSPSFVVAEANAIVTSRLMRSLLWVPTVDSSGLPITPEGYRKIVVEEAKDLPPIWSVGVLRAAWVHCVAIKRFRTLLHNRTSSVDSTALASAIQTIKELVTDIESCLVGMAEAGGIWKNTYTSYVVIKNVLARLMSDTTGPDAPLLTRDELALLNS
jgi:hypothetical protein